MRRNTMRSFKFATVNLAEMSVTFSDADTPMEHTDAELKDDNGLYTPFTVIHSNGFNSEKEMYDYCRSRHFTVV